MNLSLVRHAYLPDVTLGTLTVGALRLATLEEGWRADPDGPGGQRREAPLVESCIPDGTYVLRPHFSQKYPKGVYAFVNQALGVWYQDRPAGQAWGRQAILLHTGNHTGHIEGCVLVGMRHFFDAGRWNVLESRVAFGALKDLLGNDTHSIHISPTAGTAEL